MQFDLHPPVYHYPQKPLEKCINRRMKSGIYASVKNGIMQMS